MIDPITSIIQSSGLQTNIGIKVIDLKSKLQEKNIKYLVHEYNALFSDYMLDSLLENRIDYCFFEHISLYSSVN